MAQTHATHLTSETLARFVADELSEKDRGAAESHLDVCPSCRQALEAQEQADPWFALLRSCGNEDSASVSETPTFSPYNPDTHIPDDGGSRESPDKREELPSPINSARYSVKRLLGHGGMGTVWEAEHVAMKRRVALKTVHPHLVSEPEAIQRFHREVEAAASLDHPNIVRAYDADTTGTPFLAMEFIEGTDLARLIKESGPLSITKASEYAYQVAQGLDHAFHRGMVHRDIKPQNLMLTKEGTVKILDFGLARFVREKHAAGLTGSGVAMGTPDYMAPEQADDPHKADIRADLYSLGCTLHFLLTGHGPFPTGTPWQKLKAHAVQKPPPLDSLRPDAPSGLVHVVERLLEKDPKDRFQTPSQVVRALAPFFSTGGTAVSPANKTGPPRLPGSDEKTATSRGPLFQAKAALFLVALLMVAVCGVLLILQRSGPEVTVLKEGHISLETDEVEGKLEVQQQGTQIALLDLEASRTASLAAGEYDLIPRDGLDLVEPATRKLTVRSGAKEVVRVFRKMPLPPVEIRTFIGHMGMVAGLAFSPDGRLALSCGLDTKIRLWDVRTGDLKMTFSGHLDEVVSVAFTPDGKHFLSGGLDRSIALWEIATGRKIHSFHGHTDEVWKVIASTDGQFVVSASYDMTLRLWDLKNALERTTRTTEKEIRRFTGHTDRIRAVAISSDGKYLVSGSDDKSLRLWETDSGRQVRAFDKETDWIWCVVFTPDGKRVLSDRGALVSLWDVASGREIRTFQGHTKWNHAVVFSPDGKSAVSGGLDKTLRVWRVESGKELFSFLVPTEDVRALAIHPNGRFVLSGGVDGIVRLWRLPPPLVQK